MAYEITMPQLSDSMEEGKLIAWKIKVGDHVKIGDVIAEVESDKAIMEVQSFKEGVVRELKIKEGESAPVGSVIAVIDTSEKKESPKSSSPEITAPATSRAAKEEPIAPTNPDTSSAAPSSSVVNDLFGNATEISRSLHPQERSKGEAVASPKARALAAHYGLDLEALQKSGEVPTPAHEKDIEQAYLRRFFTPKALALLERYQIDPTTFPKGKKYTAETIEAYVQEQNLPLPQAIDSMRKAIIATVEAAAKKPTYRIYDHLDAALLKKHESERFTVTVWLLQLFAKAMMQHALLRTTLESDTLKIWPNASIALAMAHEEALYMPVFARLNQKSLEQIADELEGMKEKVRNGRIAPDQMKGSSFGLSNLGMTGIERFDAMIHGDDAAIAAVGSEIDGKIAVTLTLDHRIVNGYQAAQFMQTLKKLAKDPAIFKA